MFEEKFKEYNKVNKNVYSTFCKFAIEATNAGANATSGWLIINGMRWHSLLNDIISEDYKLPNDYIGVYTRAFALQYPQHKNLFRFKKTKRNLDELARWLVENRETTQE